MLPFFISGLHPCAPHDAEPPFVVLGFDGCAFGAGTSLPASTATTGVTSFSLLAFGAAVAVAGGGAGSAAFAGADAGSGEGAAPRLQPTVMLLAPASRTPRNTSYESIGLVMRSDGTQDASIREGCEADCHGSKRSYHCAPEGGDVRGEALRIFEACALQSREQRSSARESGGEGRERRSWIRDEINQSARRARERTWPRPPPCSSERRC